MPTSRPSSPAKTAPVSYTHLDVYKRQTVHRAVHTSIVTALVGGVLVALFGQLVAGGLMGLLNVPEDVYPLALSYLRIYLLGCLLYTSRCV